MYKRVLFFAVSALVFYTVGTSVSSAAYNASEVIGQTDLDGNVSFVKGGVNDGPKNIGFDGPHNLCADPVNNRFFVADYLNSRILVFNLDANHAPLDRTADFVLGQPDFLSNTPGIVTQSSLYRPRSCAFDQANERLFVPTDNQRVMIYDLSGGITNGMAASWVLGQSDFTSNTGAHTQTGLSTPVDVEYDEANQRLFVNEFSGNRVKIWDLSGGITNGASASFVIGQSDFTSATAANTQSGLNQPQGIGYDATNDRLFVGEFAGNRVKMFDLSGGITNGMDAHIILGQTSWTGATTGTTATTMDNATDAVYASASQKLFVSDRDNDRILVFDADPAVLASSAAATNVLGQADFTTSGPGTTINSLNVVVNAVFFDDTSDILYVPDFSNNRVIGFDVSSITDGEDATQLFGQTDANGDPVYTKGGANNGPGSTGLSSPWGVHIDLNNNRLFQVDTNNNRVLVYNLDSDGTPTDSTADFVIGQSDFTGGTASVSQSRLNAPAHALYDDTDSRLFVSDINNHRVLVFDLSGGITNGMNASFVLGQSDFTSNSSSCTQAGLVAPEGFEYDSENKRLFVGQAGGGHRVSIFDLSGGITNGASASWVLGQPDFITCTAGTTQTKMGRIVGVAWDAENERLFTGAQSPTARVLVFDLSSGITNGMAASHVLLRPDFTTTGGGSGQDGCSFPSQMGYDSASTRLFVPCWNQHRILVFNIAPGNITNGMDAEAVLGQDDFTTVDIGTSQSALSIPRGLFWDSTNRRLWVPEATNNRLLAYDLPKLTTTSISNATQGQSYSQSLTTANTQGTVTFSLVSGSLPAGLSLGSLTGTPTESGTFNFTIQATDDNGDIGSFVSNQQTYTLTVTGGGAVPLGPWLNTTPGSVVSTTSPGSVGLTEGDVISASATEPDVYIINEHGYKRLFLNPVIFSFYGHLGGFASVKSVSTDTRDGFLTSGLFRNCDPSIGSGQDQSDFDKVYAVHVTGEDTGILHHVDISGEQAVSQDPNFFKKVFCINNNEFNWYSLSGDAYTSVEQVPIYSR